MGKSAKEAAFCGGKRWMLPMVVYPLAAISDLSQWLFSNIMNSAPGGHLPD